MYDLSRESHESIVKHQEYSLDQIFEAIPSSYVEYIDQFQINTLENSGRLVPALPPKQPDNDPLSDEARNIVLGNTSYYESAVEEWLDQDYVLNRLYEQRKGDVWNEELSQAIRARRTVLVRMLLAFSQDPPVVKNTDHPAA